MAQPTLASAVVLPQASTSPPPQAGTKRRKSDASITSPKRQRLSPSPSLAENTTHSGATPPGPRDDSTSQSNFTRKASGALRIDEKKRSQRLFGALLGTPGPQRSVNSAAAKRRAEQDERRRDETRKREAEIGERQKLRIDRLNLVRRKEQRKVDEVNMRLKHTNMMATVNFLVTDTEPKLYYRPWELRPEDEQRMKRRREELEAQIDRELDSFTEMKRKWREEDGEPQPENNQSTEISANDPEKTDYSGVTRTETHRSGAVDLEIPKDVLSDEDDQDEVGLDTIAQDSHAENERQSKESIDDDAGDVVVEGEEDTVIY